MNKLPIGIQTFSKIRSDEYYYVDKTKILFNLTESGTYFFLSRPRRFGKSLFLDTLKEAFLGNKNLFNGLYLEKNWNWNKKYPVIKLDFGSGVLKDPKKLEQVIYEILDESCKKESIELKNESISGKFRELITKLEKKYSEKVVILIDEYDKPILDNITKKETAREMRDVLRNFYSVIKGADAHLKFVFITGVSKFSKVNLFSGLNNIQDITLDERVATICGYTENELSIFQDRLDEINREDLKDWYNGYNFLGESVYNPFDVLLFLDSKKFKNYWFETGNPSFLIDLIRERNYQPIEMENINLSEEQLSSFDIDNIELETLLFQTGYLTIEKEYTIGSRYYYKLKYPNKEVKQSLNAVILRFLTESKKIPNIQSDLYKSISSGEIENLKNVFYSFFASIPNDWYRKNTIANYEGYYSAIFYSYFAALGLELKAEDMTNQGRADLTVFFESKVFVFEFKVIEMTEEGSALKQIKEKKYYEKYLSGMSSKYEIYLVGVEFSKEQKNISNFEWEKI